MHQTYFTSTRQEASWMDIQEVLTNYDSCRNLTNQNTDKESAGSLCDDCDGGVRECWCPVERSRVYTSVRTIIRTYSNIFLRILIFIFDSWQFSKPNIIHIFEYFCTNISEYWSLKITWNTGIRGVSFLTWIYILTTILITMINSCWSTNP